MSNSDIKNKRASFEYEFLDDFVAGIVLTGTEIKSIRNGKASITEAFCVLKNGVLLIRNMYIAEYEAGSYYNHEPKRDRILLLNRTELNKLERKLKDKGLTVIASKLFINEKNLAKLKIHLARGKKLHDKRQDLKTKDTKRDMERAMKS
ncbi:MAG: SsrA-binding protein SmpB [Crocinitomicaceae bacterium]|nr:SsrA-binding protein SmpB [Crocinitomicaceae bacterium]